MAKKWINTTQWGYHIDSNSEMGYSYQEISVLCCPFCKKIYPTNIYFTEANFCPNCGEDLNTEQ